MFIHDEQIDFLKSQLFLPSLSNFLNFDIIENFKKNSNIKYRDRIYSLDVVLQIYIYQAVQDDKSDTNAVKFISNYYKTYQKKVVETNSILLEQNSNLKKRGRPKTKFVNTQKSKLKDISLFPSSINEAKQRFPLELMKHVFKNIDIPTNPHKHWHNHNIYIVDGTTFVTPDTKELRDYFMPDGVHPDSSLPIVKFSGLIDYKTGMFVDFVIDNYRSSESKMLKKMYSSMEVGSILLGDDLYSSASHMQFAISQNKHIISQGKHKRIDKLVKNLGKNDDIVEWKTSKKPSWYSEEDNWTPTIQVRKITYKNPRNPNYDLTIYTTLLDSIKYPCGDIIALYASRWDIEIGFRELKKIMRLEHLRTFSIQMVKKEIYSHIIAYNILKKIIYSVFKDKDTEFFPLREELQNNYRTYTNELYNLDKLGRSYIRKSPGRYGGGDSKNTEEETRKQK